MTAHERRNLILNYIRNHCADTGQAPTSKQIQRGLQLRTPNLLAADLQAMTRGGQIARNGGRPSTFYAIEETQS